MNAVTRRRTILVAGSFTLFLPLLGIAAENAPPEALNVKVFPDRYVAAGKLFKDLAALEAWAKPIHIRVLWLDGCSPTATKPLLAAVERFHSVYPEGIQIRTFGPKDAGCVSAAARASWTEPRVSLFAASDGYYASDESGRSMMP